MSEQSQGALCCPACGQQALPKETRCHFCGSRLQNGTTRNDAASEAVSAEPFALAKSPPTLRCPECRAVMAAEAVLCIACGFHLHRGKRLRTVHEASRATEERAVPEPLTPGFHYVRLGLAFHSARLILALLNVVATGLLGYGATAGQPPGETGQLLLLIAVLSVIGLSIATVAMGIAGSVLCLWAPWQSGMKALILAYLILDVIPMPLTAVLALVAAPPPLMFAIGWGFSFIAWIVFMLFLRKLAAYLERPGEADEIHALLIWGTGSLLGAPLLLVLLNMLGVLGAFPAWSVKFVAGGILLAWFAMLLRLFNRILENIRLLREAIGQGLAKFDDHDAR